MSQVSQIICLMFRLLEFSFNGTECSCIGLSKVRLTGRKLSPCLVVMAYTSPIPAQGKVVLSFALTFPGGFLNLDIVPLNTRQRLASPLFCFSYVFRRDGTAKGGPCERRFLGTASVRKRSSGRESSPDSEGGCSGGHCCCRQL